MITHFLKVFLITFTLGIINIAMGQTVEKVVKVGILVPLQHKAMDEIVSGFETTLTQQYSQKIEFEVKNAQSDLNLQRAILQEFKNSNIDMIAPIGTVATQMTLNMIKNKPIISIAALYSEAERDKRSFKNVTGVFDEIDVATQIDYLLKAIPSCHKLTLIHSPSEKVYPAIKKLKHIAKDKGLEVQILMAQSLPDLYTISRRIDKNTDVIFVLKDNLIVSGIRTLAKTAEKLHIPLMTSDQGSVKEGAAFALGVEEQQIGVNAAFLAVQVLKGIPVGDLPLQTMTDYSVFINPKILQKQNLTLEQLENAAKTLGYKAVVLSTAKVLKNNK